MAQILPPPPHNVPQPLHLLRRQIPLLQCRLPCRRSLGTLACDERPLVLPRALPPDPLFCFAAAIPAVDGDVPSNVSSVELLEEDGSIHGGGGTNVGGGGERKSGANGGGERKRERGLRW
ncbi:hypothetical protein LR48_Vigan06g152400 [Vigna angularis]|uniref:Uncharacterized protein n=1 Tax=Phaseolus angularis TaxID=3914 RepID=A0A0L9UTZ0_PHAAN|nr:hypothetical protein LR48_Vigan06g152400 [Vigna angularis]